MLEVCGTLSDVNVDAFASLKRALPVGGLGTVQSLCYVTLGKEVTHHRDDGLITTQPDRRTCARPAGPNKTIHQTKNDDVSCLAACRH